MDTIARRLSTEARTSNVPQQITMGEWRDYTKRLAVALRLHAAELEHLQGPHTLWWSLTEALQTLTLGLVECRTLHSQTLAVAGTKGDEHAWGASQAELLDQLRPLVVHMSRLVDQQRRSVQLRQDGPPR